MQLKTLIILLVLFSCSLAALAPERKAELKKRVREAIDDWQNFYSGKPVQCIYAQFLFGGHAYVQSSNYTISGVGPIFRTCEAYLQAFEQVDVFITSPIFYGNWQDEEDLAVSFSNTNVYMTKSYCRLYSQGVTTFKFKVFENPRKGEEGHPDELLLITDWYDFYDKDDFDRQMELCRLPFEFPPLEAAKQPDEQPEEL